MKIHDFVERYRLRVKRAEDGELIVPAKLGHLYSHDPDRGIFGLVLEAPDDDFSLDNTLRARKRKAEKEGLQVHQEGDFEAILLFDANDSKKARLAIRLVRARRKRKVQVSAASLANLRKTSTQRPQQRPESPIPA